LAKWWSAAAPRGKITVPVSRPDQDSIHVTDHVQGDVTLNTREIDDLILLRADGTPTYMLAVVVDDHDMGVTQVVRGDDHFRNTFRQLPIFWAMDWAAAEFAHVPMIHGADGGKLSQRHGALSTLAYREMGYLPEAMTSYLVRLGWSHGDQEVFTMEDAAAVFDLKGINKAPARLDLEKLNDVNAHFIRTATEPRLLSVLLPEIEKLTPITPALTERLQQALPSLKDRGQTLPDLAEACRFLWDANAENLNKKARKALREDGVKRLRDLRQALDLSESWTIEALQDVLDAFCAAHTLNMGQVGPPLRAALTGGLPAPELAPVMHWLGRDEVLRRIETHLPA